MNAPASGSGGAAHGLPVYDSDRRPPAFVGELHNLWRYRDLVRLWTVRNITLRYKRSQLGVLWTFIEPLVLMIILTVVFSKVFRFAMASYPVYLLAGLLAFDFLSRSTSQIVDEIIASQNLATRIRLPRSAFAVAAVCSSLVNWVLAFGLLVGIMLALGHPVSWWLLTVPLSMLLLALFALGIGLTVATLGAFFHDFAVTYKVLLQVWFWATPIIYPLEVVPERYAALFRLNPLYHLIGLFRALVYSGNGAEPGTWLASLAFGLFAAAIGWWVFTRWQAAFEYRV